MTSTAQTTRNPADGTRFGSADSKASYMFENAFQNTDPFSPLAKNVVSLSFSSLQSPEELEMKTPMGGIYQSPVSEGARRYQSPISEGGREGSGKKMSPPKVAFVFPSPDSKESKHPPVFSTFSKFDAAKDNGNNSPVPIHTPTESQDSSVSHHTPSIWLTNVRGSSHNLLGAKAEKENTRRRVQSWTGEPTPFDENKSRLRHHETRAQSASVYPPEESNTKSYTFNPAPISSKDRTYSVDTSDTTMHMYSPSPNYMVSDDLYCKQDISDYERKLDCKERVGWCLIIFGFAIFISAVIVILVVEIPAHDFEDGEFEPDSKPFYDYMEGVKEDVLSNLQ
ncbi:uncharacterized protein [Palaemon carinicauda]|uniref:uncharacterized protein n=1 Tax=Palaemon carinicauda TaxID=392227 RepID=UPI0035B5B816